MKEVKEKRYADGKLDWRANYRNGKRHGISKWWFEDGQLQLRYNFINGEYYGLEEWWSQDGKQLEKDYELL